MGRRMERQKEVEIDRQVDGLAGWIDKYKYGYVTRKLSVGYDYLDCRQIE